MGTLYDLLGALPRDDAESLRTAFRRAAKASHPDINPDNPDASLRFRELMRAYDILNDAEQRVTYDELLAIAMQPPPAKSTRVYETIGKLASSTIAATLISGALVGGYMLLGRITKTQEAAAMAADATVLQPSELAAAPVVQPDLAAVRDVLRDARAATGMADEMVKTSAVTPHHVQRDRRERDRHQTRPRDEPCQILSRTRRVRLSRWRHLPCARRFRSGDPA